MQTTESQKSYCEKTEGPHGGAAEAAPLGRVSRGNAVSGR
jgi:hypothetical protein